MCAQSESGQYVCELCENHGKAAPTAQSADNDNSEMILECNAGITPTESPSHHSTSHFHVPCSPGKVCIFGLSFFTLYHYSWTELTFSVLVTSTNCSLLIRYLLMACYDDGFS